MIGDQALVIRVALRLPDLLDGNLALDFPYYVIELSQVLIQLVNCLANLEGEQLALILFHRFIRMSVIYFNHKFVQFKFLDCDIK